MRSCSREHDVRGEGFVDDDRGGPLRFEQARELRREGARGALAANDVERAIARGGHEPRRGIRRRAAEFPDVERAGEGVLHDVLRQREIVRPEQPRERGGHASGFVAEQMLVQDAPLRVRHRAKPAPTSPRWAALPPSHPDRRGQGSPSRARRPASRCRR